MRKTILAVFVVVILTTPCLAQEIEPDGIFSLDGTLWKYSYREVVVDILPSPSSYYIVRHGGKIWFYEGNVYKFHSKGLYVTGTYIDTPVLGISYEIKKEAEWMSFYLYVMQPTTGVGLIIRFSYVDTSYMTQLVLGLGTMIKIDNNWEPYGPY